MNELEWNLMINDYCKRLPGCSRDAVIVMLLATKPHKGM